MPKSKPHRLGRALEAAEKFAARLPPPRPKRDKRILVAWSDEEYQRVQKFAEQRGEPLAAVVRILTLAALDTLHE